MADQEAARATYDVQSKFRNREEAILLYVHYNRLVVATGPDVITGPGTASVWRFAGDLPSIENWSNT